MLKSLLVGLVLVAAVGAAGIAYWSNGDLCSDGSCCPGSASMPACCSEAAAACCQEDETSPSTAAPDCCAAPKAKCCEEKATTAGVK